MTTRTILVIHNNSGQINGLRMLLANLERYGASVQSTNQHFLTVIKRWTGEGLRLIALVVTGETLKDAPVELWLTEARRRFGPSLPIIVTSDGAVMPKEIEDFGVMVCDSGNIGTILPTDACACTHQ